MTDSISQLHLQYTEQGQKVAKEKAIHQEIKTELIMAIVKQGAFHMLDIKKYYTPRLTK